MYNVASFCMMDTGVIRTVLADRHDTSREESHFVDSSRSRTVLERLGVCLLSGLRIAVLIKHMQRYARHESMSKCIKCPSTYVFHRIGLQSCPGMCSAAPASLYEPAC